MGRVCRGLRNDQEHTSSIEHNNVTSTEMIPPSRRYSRFLYEIWLGDEKLKDLGYFQDVPLQENGAYTDKFTWCDRVCFGKERVYFYSRVPGSRNCPIPSNMKEENEHQKEDEEEES